MASVCLRDFLYITSKTSFPLALLLTLITFVLAWISFVLPDWISYISLDGIQVKFGLWSECKKIKNFNTQFVCQFWSPSNLPDFLKTVQPLIALGCVFVTSATFLSFLAIFMNKGILKYLRLFAALSNCTAFLFFLVGLSVFGEEFEIYIINIVGISRRRKWAYWVQILLLIFLLASSVLYTFKFVYDNFFANRIYNFVHNSGKESNILDLGLDTVNSISRSHSENFQTRNATGFNNTISSVSFANNIETSENDQNQINSIQQNGEQNAHSIILRPNDLRQQEPQFQHQNQIDNDLENGYFNPILDNSFSPRVMTDSFINRPAREENYLSNLNDETFHECHCHSVLHQNNGEHYDNQFQKNWM